MEAELFGRRVGELALEAVDDRALALFEELGDSEVDDLRFLHATIRQDDVVRGHIAMDHTLAVCRSEAVRHARAEDRDVVGRERAIVHLRGQRDALDHLHDEVDATLLVREQVVAMNDRGVAHREQRLRLAIEELARSLLFRELRVHDLDRAVLVEAAVPGAVDLAHAAYAEHVHDLVFAEEHRAGSQAAIRIDRGHGSRRPRIGPQLRGGLDGLWRGLARLVENASLRHRAPLAERGRRLRLVGRGAIHDLRPTVVIVRRHDGL